MARFDYVIVGAGSAGCVLAARLSEDPAIRVALLEAGGRNRSLFISMPTAFAIPMADPRYNWGYVSEAEPYLDGRRLDCPRGKGLGGSSAINGMVYVRGHACDFDEWDDLGAAGWAYADCLPYFKRAESWIGGGDEYRGAEGPLSVCAGNGGRLNPLYAAFVAAGRQAGYGTTSDSNGYRQEGFGPMQMTLSKGARCSAADAYLRPVQRRPNLHVITACDATRVIFDHRRAAGVEIQRDGKREQIMVDREVILAAGAIGSPTLLQRSGVGAPAVIRAAGVELCQELPGVGENLQDHLEIYLQYRCRRPITLNGRLGMLSKGLIGARWLLLRDGLGATNHFESGAFIRSREGVKWPDIQYHFLPAAIRYDGKSALAGHGFQVHVGPNKPRSRGCVRIASADAGAAPRIRFNYLQDEQDRRDWRACVALSREILSQPALDEYRGEEVQPGPSVADDKAVDAWLRANVESAYHPCGTCRMGNPSDPLAVLDAECRVLGLQGLRVADASAFPSITNGNLNAPTIMLAERAADLILGRTPLRSPGAAAWTDPGWRTRQREGVAQRPRAELRAPTGVAR